MMLYKKLPKLFLKTKSDVVKVCDISIDNTKEFPTVYIKTGNLNETLKETKEIFKENNNIDPMVLANNFAQSEWKNFIKKGYNF